jgi:2-dehydro-3-deoxygalactonokinase
MRTNEPLYLVDMGSTRCRVWLTEKGRDWARASADFGVRDVARGVPVSVLRQQLDRLIAEAGEIGLQAGISTLPRFGIGAGMISSAQGLMEIPHVPAPAAVADLAGHMQAYRSGEPSGLTLFLVPGVKTLSQDSDVDSVLLSDMMRGEESLCIGLLATEQIRGPGAVLNLGSHWKWIFLDSEGRIAGSRTSLTGEIIHAVQSQTLLASGLPQMRPTSLDPEWLALGSREYRRSGLSRALFCVRLLEQTEKGTDSQRLAFLYGVFLEADLEAFRNSHYSREMKDVSLIGPPSLTAAWQRGLSGSHLRISVVSEEQRDNAYLQGLTRIFDVAREQGLLPSSH